MTNILFYVLAVVALLGAAGVVLARSPMGSVVSLLGTFFALAVIYLLAGFQFIAGAQILVYAGAILVLFLFVIMLLNLGAMGSKFELSFAPLQSTRARVAGCIALALALVGLVAAQRASFKAVPERDASAPAIDSMEGLALELLGRYSLPFQATSLLLLMTMVGVIVLAKRQRSGDEPAKGDQRP